MGSKIPKEFLRFPSEPLELLKQMSPSSRKATLRCPPCLGWFIAGILIAKKGSANEDSAKEIIEELEAMNAEESNEEGADTRGFLSELKQCLLEETTEEELKCLYKHVDEASDHL